MLSAGIPNAQNTKEPSPPDKKLEKPVLIYVITRLSILAQHIRIIHPPHTASPEVLKSSS
jgi:hypothetical protein